MKLSEFYYDLPEAQIAQKPMEPRDHSRLLVVHRAAGELEHRSFFQIEEYLQPGDVLVMNSTKVVPARLRGKKRTGGKVEALLIAKSADDSQTWRALVRGSMKPVDILFPEGMVARMERSAHEGEWLLHFSTNSIRSYLDRHGEMPLPPYIKRPQVSGEDIERYQTVFAKTEGAVAAPTAGFHFTHELLRRLKMKGVELVELTLHVGWGTFRPIRTESIEEHRMLPEYYSVSSSASAVLNLAKSDHRRIVAVGTTTVRTLETIANASGQFTPGEGETNLFIYPGYAFKAVGALITNFHLPDSTPLLLANAFYADKAKRTDSFPLRPAYKEAIREGYRFYSWGCHAASMKTFEVIKRDLLRRPGSGNSIPLMGWSTPRSLLRWGLKVP